MLEPIARRAQLQALVHLADGGSIDVLEGAKVLATFQLAQFHERPDGMWAVQPTPEEAAEGGRPTVYHLKSRDGAILGMGTVGQELTITPPELRPGTRVVADVLVLKLGE